MRGTERRFNPYTDIDKLLPPVSRFGGGRAEKKHAVIDRFNDFFDWFRGVGGEFKAERE